MALHFNLWSAAVAFITLGTVVCGASAEALPTPYLIPLRRESVPIRRKGKVVSFKTSYSGNISVGRPAQEFRVVFDTGSGHLVLPSTECFSEACLAHRRYNLTVSETAVPINADGSEVAPDELCDQVTIGFGTGKITGELAREQMCLGSEARPAEDPSSSDTEPCLEMHVVTAVEMSTQPFKSFAFDGILGLALSGLALSPSFSFLESFRGGAGRPAQFAAFLTDGEDGEASEIAFGGYNPARLLEPLSWAPVVLPELGHWQVQILAIRVGGTQLDICDDGTCRGVLDTGTSHLGVPATYNEKVASMLTQTVSAGTDCLAVDAPVVEIEIPGKVLTLLPENYMRRMPLEENVSVGIHGVSLDGSTPRRPHSRTPDAPAREEPATQQPRLRASKAAPEADGAGAEAGRLLCSPKLMPVSLPAPLGPKLFILGEPALHRYYTVFDYERRRVGLGLAANRQNRAFEAEAAAVAAASAQSAADPAGAATQESGSLPIGPIVV